MTPLLVACGGGRGAATALLDRCTALFEPTFGRRAQDRELHAVSEHADLGLGAVIRHGPLHLVVSAAPDQLAAEGAGLAAVLEAYLQQGPAALDGWRQPWSVILWDQRAQEWCLRRDELGIAPLYYRDPGLRASSASPHGGGFVASSSLALLAGLTPADAVSDETAIADQLLGTFLPPARTHYRHYHAVPPGHWLRIDAQGRPRVQRYWALPPPRDWHQDTAPRSDRQDADAAAELRALLQQATARQLSGPAIGSWLSAGLDSAAVTALAAAARPAAAAADGGRGSAGASPLRTLSLRFPGVPTADEGPYLASFRRRWPTQHQDLVFSGIDPVAHLPALQAACGQPFLMGNSIYPWLLAKASVAAGCQAVLTGHDGDSVFGYRTRHLGDLVRQGQLARALGAWALLAYHQCLPRRRLFTESLWTPLLQRARHALGRLPPPPRHASVALAALLERTGAWSRAEAQWAGLAQQARSARDEHFRELTSRSLAQATTFFAHLGQAHGLSIRHPLLDVRLVEYCYQLPAPAMLRHGWTRYALRQAMSGLLPEELRWRRRKADLSRPLYAALAQHGQTSARALLTAPALSPYVRPDGIATLLGTLSGSPVHDLDDETLPGIWSLLWLAAWLPSTVA